MLTSKHLTNIINKILIGLKWNNIMIFKKSVNNIFRSKSKVILFFFLILLLTTILSLSLGICVSTQEFLDQCNENYTTVAILEYMSPDYPDISIYDEHMQEVVSELDFSLIEDNENVILWDRSARALGYVDGFERKDFSRPLMEYGVLIVEDIHRYEMLRTQNSMYSGIIKETLSSNERAGRALFVRSVGNSDYDIDPDKLYFVHGEYVKGRSGYVDIIAVPFFHDAAKAAGMTDGAEYMISDITNYYDEENLLDEETIFSQIAQTYNVTNNSVHVFAVSDVNSIYEFNQQQLLLAKGRLFSEEEYNEGKNVCIVSTLFTKKYGVDIGDEIPLSLALTKNASYYESYWAGAGFAHLANYEIVGVTNDNRDCNYNIYIPKSPDIDYTVNQIGYTIGGAIIDNDGAAEFYNEVVQKLPERMRLTMYDQGYSNAVEPFKDILRVSKIIAVVSIIAALAILVFFGFIFVYRQRDVSDTMIKLGAGKFKVCRYFLYASLTISIIAAILGIWISHVLSGYVTQIVKNIASNYNVYNLGYSNGSLSLIKESAFDNQISDRFLMYIGAVVVFFSLLSCMLFTFATFKKRKKKKKRKITYNRKGHTSTIRSVSLKYSMLSIFRGKIRTVVIPIFSISVVLLLSQLVFTSVGYQNDLNDITQNAVVNGHFTDIKGKAVKRIPIDAYQIKDLNNSGFVEDLNVSRTNYFLYIGKHDQDASEIVFDSFRIPSIDTYAFETFITNIKRGPNLIYSTSIKKSPDFYYSSSVKTEFLEGYDESILGQKVDGLPCCIVSTDYMKDKNIKLGDTIRIFELRQFLNFSYSQGVDMDLGELIRLMELAQSSSRNLPVWDLKVVGSYEKHGSKDNIYCQLGAYLDPEMIYDYKSSDNEPLFDYTFDSANFTLTNAANLTDFKTFLSDYGFSYPSGINKYRSFILLEDMKFNNTVDMLTQQIRYINVLYPVLYALLGIISVIVSYLLVVSRRKEFAMMRGLGARKRTTFMSFFIEQGLMCIIGTLAGLGLSLLIYGTLNILQIYLISGFVVCYFIGCAISITIMNNKPVLAILKYED